MLPGSNKNREIIFVFPVNHVIIKKINQILGNKTFHGQLTIKDAASENRR